MTAFINAVSCKDGHIGPFVRSSHVDAGGTSGVICQCCNKFIRVVDLEKPGVLTDKASKELPVCRGVSS